MYKTKVINKLTVSKKTEEGFFVLEDSDCSLIEEIERLGLKGYELKTTTFNEGGEIVTAILQKKITI